MKKRFVTIVMLLCLTLTLGAFGFAAAADLYNVTDDAGILTEDQYNELEATAESISSQYGCGVYIIALEDYTGYYGGSVLDCAKSFFTDYSLGEGADQSGVLLLLSMADRDFALIAHGDVGNTAFTDYGKEVVEEAFLDNFAEDDWYGGFTDYLSKCDELLYAQSLGSPVDVGDSGYSEDYTADDYADYSGGGFYFDGTSFLIYFVISAVVALIVCLILKAQMKSVAPATSASAYITPGSVNLREKSDHFTHTTETRVKIERDNDSGGTTIGSDGFSGDSGKF